MLDANKTALLEPANLIVHPSDILVIPGPESDKGNLGYNCFDIAMHDAYFIDVAGCPANESTPVLEGELALTAADPWDVLLISVLDFVEDMCDVFLICCITGFDLGTSMNEQIING